MATWHHQTKQNDSDNGGDEGEGETRGGGKLNKKKGLRDVVNVSWATGTFFCFIFVSHV
jgi:hypothetical protein